MSAIRSIVMLPLGAGGAARRAVATRRGRANFPISIQIAYLLLVSFDRRAGADQVAVSVNVIDAAYRSPILIHARRTCGEAAFGSRIRPVPIVFRQIVDGVGSMPQRRISNCESSVLHVGDLFPDRD